MRTLKEALSRSPEIPPGAQPPGATAPQGGWRAPTLALVRPVHAVDARADIRSDCDETDLESVYRCYARQVSIWAERLAGPGFDLPDIVHDVFLVVERRLCHFKGQAKLSTWLYEITLRVVHTHRRKARKRMSARPLLETNEHGVGLLASDNRLSPLDAVTDREATALLYRFLDQLDEKYRTAVVLFELEELSCTEIATITNTSVNNVWARISRARQMLLLAFAKWEKPR